MHQDISRTLKLSCYNFFDKSAEIKPMRMNKACEKEDNGKRIKYVTQQFGGLVSIYT